MKTSRLGHRTALVAVLAAAASWLSVTSAMAATEGSAPSAVPSCVFNGQPSGSDIGNVAGTAITVACTNAPIGGFLLSYSSPLAGLPGLSLAEQTNLTLGTKSFSGTTTFAIPPEGTTPANTDGTCPPTQAQVNAGLTNCSVAVTNALGTTLYGYAVVNYPDQLAPATTTLTLTPSSGSAGTTVSVSGSNWWGDALNTVSPTITVDGVPLATSNVTIPATTYKPGSGLNGSNGTLTGGAITGDFNIPLTATGNVNVTITELTKDIPANDPPYSDSPIVSATAQFAVSAPPGSSPLAITPIRLPACYVGQPYIALLMATGGTPPYTSWSGTLPPGLNLTSVADGLFGVISGIPTEKGKFTVQVGVTDSASRVATITFSIKCSPRHVK